MFLPRPKTSSVSFTLTRTNIYLVLAGRRAHSYPFQTY